MLGNHFFCYPIIWSVAAPLSLSLKTRSGIGIYLSTVLGKRASAACGVWGFLVTEARTSGSLSGARRASVSGGVFGCFATPIRTYLYSSRLKSERIFGSVAEFSATRRLTSSWVSEASRASVSGGKDGFLVR